MLRHQSVAEHSHRVAAIAFELASVSNDVDMHAKYKIAWLGMIHDAPEAETGDMPGPAKSLIEGSIEVAEKKLTTWDREQFPLPYHKFVKYADCIETLCWFQKYAVESLRKEVIRVDLVSAVNRASAYLSPQVAKRGDQIIEAIMNDMEVVNGAKLNNVGQGKDPLAGEGSSADLGRRFGNTVGSVVRAGDAGQEGRGGPDPGVPQRGPGEDA